MTTTIVGAEQLAGELAELQPLAEAMFGPGLRRSCWLARKLVRECVDPRACSLLVLGPVGAGELVEVERVVGYALVGRPASLGRLARGTGVGVIQRLRGRGLGAALVHASCERAASLGVAAIEFLAEPARVRWYAGMGFETIRCEWTLLAHGTSERMRFDWAAAPEPAPPAACLWSWIEEAWQRTPAHERVGLDAIVGGQRLRVWASREGQALLVHRLELGEPGHVREPAQIVDALNHVRARLPRGTPLLLYPCPAQRPWSRALIDHGWTIAQRSWVLRRALG